MGSVSVSPSSGARNLGVYFDNQLSLKQHISNVCKSCHFQLRQLRVIRHSLSSDVLRTLLQAFVTCRLDYCNSLLVGLLACDISRLQSVQNAAGRLIGAYPYLYIRYRAIMRLMSNLVSAVESGKLALMFFLDMSAAFDTVDHDILHQTELYIRNTWRRVQSDHVLPRGAQKVCEKCRLHFS